MKRWIMAGILAVGLFMFAAPVTAVPVNCWDNYYYTPYGEDCMLSCTTHHCEYDGGIVIETNHTVLVCPGYTLDYGWSDGGCTQ